MAEIVSRKEKIKSKKAKFKQFLKKNMTRTWAKRVSYQIFAFLVSVAMIVGVAVYAFNKTYNEREISFMDDFTITAHTGAFDTPDNTMESIETAISHKMQVCEIDIRQRPDGTLVMAHDIVANNNDGVEVDKVFDRVSQTDMKLNLDIKEVRVLPALYDMITDYGFEERAFLTGIDEHQADKVKQSCPGIAYYINYWPSRIRIFSDDYQKEILDILSHTGAIGINCNHICASRTLSSLLHDNGYKLSVWTVNRKYQMTRALVNKPDNITTRCPDKLKKVIDEWGND